VAQLPALLPFRLGGPDGPPTLRDPLTTTGSNTLEALLSEWSARKGDGGTAITAVLRDASGVVDLTGASVLFQARFGTNTINGTCVVASPATGSVTYTLTTAQLASVIPGPYDVTWQATWSAAAVTTFPRPGVDRLNILDQID